CLGPDSRLQHHVPTSYEVGMERQTRFVVGRNIRTNLTRGGYARKSDAHHSYRDGCDCDRWSQRYRVMKQNSPRSMLHRSKRSTAVKMTSEMRLFPASLDPNARQLFRDARQRFS